MSIIPRCSIRKLPGLDPTVHRAAVYEETFCGKKRREHHQELPVFKDQEIRTELLPCASRGICRHNGPVVSPQLVRREKQEPEETGAAHDDDKANVDGSRETVCRCEIATYLISTDRRKQEFHPFQRM